MKLAGFKSGKYSGNATLQVVGANGGTDSAVIQIVNSDLTRLGFKTHIVQVDPATMAKKYCGVPAREIDVCATVGRIRNLARPGVAPVNVFLRPCDRFRQQLQLGAGQ